MAATGIKIINNVVYQWGSELGATTAGAVADWIGNYFQPGNLSAVENHLVHNAFDKHSPSNVYASPSLYMQGNLMVPGTRDWDLYTVHYTPNPIPASFKRASPLPAAPTPVPVETAEATRTSVLNDVGANPGRSGHRLSLEAGRIVYRAREAMAEILGVPDPLRVAFGASNIDFMVRLRPPNSADQICCP